ncbi:MAG: cell division protein FtsQ/DivIB [Polyangiaceae bacterium]
MKAPNRRVARPKLPADLVEAMGMELPPEPEPEIAEPLQPKPPNRFLGIARAGLGIALVVGVSGTAALGARRYVTSTPRFAVKEIDVSGNVRRTSDDIAAEAGIAKGENVFSLDLDRARARLLADPWIRDASIARRLPGTVTVQVTERDAAAIVALGDSYLASRDGDVFKRLEPGDPTDLPAVTGLTPDAVAEDREGAIRSIRRALDLAAEYDRSPLAAKAPLEEVHIADGEALTLFVGKSAIALELGVAPFHHKLEEAAKVLAELERRGAKADAIMLDSEAHPERVVARVR